MNKYEDCFLHRWREKRRIQRLTAGESVPDRSVDISDDAFERSDGGAYERHQMERRRLQAKQQHSERRKAWLRTNQALLRVFLSYCSLHGAKGGGVTSVRMELLFLLQESQQVRSILTIQVKVSTLQQIDDSSFHTNMRQTVGGHGKRPP